MKADLHLHTTESDGTWLPEELLMQASQRGIEIIAITDHDTTSGVTQAIRAKPANMTVIPGIEISTNDQYGGEVHILGYWIDIYNQELQSTLTELRTLRVNRAHEMIANLNKLGIDITFTEVQGATPRQVVSRSHIATVLKNKGVVQTKAQAFNELIGVNSPAYVPRPKMSPADAVELVLACGGIPALAHPGLLLTCDIIPQLTKVGLVALEVIHSSHTEKQTHFFHTMANNLGLLPSGGSDCHGPGGKDCFFLGDYTIPLSWVEDLYERKQRIK